MSFAPCRPYREPRPPEHPPTPDIVSRDLAERMGKTACKLGFGSIEDEVDLIGQRLATTSKPSYAARTTDQPRT